MTTDNTYTPGEWRLDLETWKRALIAGIEPAQTAAGLLVAVTLAEQLRPWLEADMRRAAE
ncbi:MAG: hypothetical protein F2520_09205 [Actinobacteria bacterium]|uniref:Unannotated protein n=1 Tax=freshwater metagenome TaxID=449393 RepID=A0A6J7KE31_9ZZZZ|nr:hypothetical protein [Actinomycetota bacterium]MTA78425.1 hypothetical protein [Actinomycetota bacterium]